MPSPFLNIFPSVLCNSEHFFFTVATLSEQALNKNIPDRCAPQAAKAAVVDFYETLRYEVKDEVGVTVATHGWVGGGGGGRFTREDGAAEMQWKEEREATLSGGGHGQVEAYARALVAGACRGDAYVKRPSWYDVFLVFRVFAPDVLAWTFRLLLSTAAPGPATAAAPARRPRPAALPAPPVRPLLEYPAAAAARRPAAQLQQKLE
jgi:NAD(P)-dependent dehydrogenase (short-subunit alcohol dehydrogenase family)